MLVPSHRGVFPSRGGLLLLLLLQVGGPFDARLPALRFALGFSELDHKEGQDDHGSQEGEDRDGLTHFLVVTTRHDP